MASAVDIVALVRVLGRISAEELPKTDSNDSNLAQVAMEIDLSVLNDLEAHSKICIEIKIDAAALPESSSLGHASTRMQEKWKAHSSMQNYPEFSVSWRSNAVNPSVPPAGFATICTVTCEIQSSNLTELVGELNRSFGKDAASVISDKEAGTASTSEPHFQDGVFIIPEDDQESDEEDQSSDEANSNEAIHIVHALSSIIRSSRDIYWRQECKRLLEVSSVDKIEAKLEELLRARIN